MLPRILLLLLLCSRSSCAMLWADCLLPGWPYFCVCVCRIPIWVSLVQQRNSHLVGVLLPAPPNWRAPFLLKVSHSLWWVINLSDRVTAVILWAFVVPLAEFQRFTHNHNFQSGWIKDRKWVPIRHVCDIQHSLNLQCLCPNEFLISMHSL